MDVFSEAPSLFPHLMHLLYAGVGVMVLMIPLNGFIAKKSRSQQVIQMGQKDQRMKLMNEVGRSRNLALSFSSAYVHMCFYVLVHSP